VAEVLPLLIAAGALLIAAISPVVTFGSRVLFELPHQLYAPFATFRASGRFVLVPFFVMLFLLLRWLGRLRPTWAASLVLLAIVVIEIRDIERGLSRYASGAARVGSIAWEQPLRWESWRFATDSYRRIIHVPRGGWRPDVLIAFSYLAARSGLAINVGEVGRADIPALFAAARALDRDVAAGRLDPEAVYIVHASFVDRFMADNGDRVTCRAVDGFHACTLR
jgi:hypothetical protein